MSTSRRQKSSLEHEIDILSQDVIFNKDKNFACIIDVKHPGKRLTFSNEKQICLRHGTMSN